MASVHLHKPNSPTGWIHNDFHYCNFVWSPNSDGINPAAEGANYQYGYDQRPDVLKCFRSVALLYYFGNEAWSEGDGGETYLFRSKNWNDVFMKVPPINNTLLAFEVTPQSWHSFVENTKNDRTAAAFWYHSQPVVSAQKFGVFPKVANRPY